MSRFAVIYRVDHDKIEEYCNVLLSISTNDNREAVAKAWAFNRRIKEKYVILGNWVDCSRRHSKYMFTKKRLQFLLNTSRYWKATLEEAHAQVIINLKEEVARQKTLLDMRGNLNNLYVQLIEENKVKEREMQANLNVEQFLSDNRAKIIEGLRTEIKDLRELSGGLAERNNELLKDIQLRKAQVDTYRERAEKFERNYEEIQVFIDNSLEEVFESLQSHVDGMIKDINTRAKKFKDSRKTTKSEE